MTTMEVTPTEVVNLVSYGRKTGFVFGIIATLGAQYLLRNRKTLLGSQPLVNQT